MDIYESLNYITKLALPKKKYDWKKEWNLDEEYILFQVTGWSNKISDYVEDYFEKGLKAFLKVLEEDELEPEVIFYGKQLVVALANSVINYHSDIAKNKAEVAYKLYKKNSVFRDSVIEYASHLHKLIPNIIAYAFFHLDLNTVKDICETCIPKYRIRTKQHKNLMEKLHDEFTYNHSFYELLNNDNVLKYWEIANYINENIPQLKFFETNDGIIITEVINDLNEIETLVPLRKLFDKGIYWINLEELPEILKFEYIYPNGSNGDIVKYILEEYGKTEQKSANLWVGKISKEHIDLFEMLAPTAMKISTDDAFLKIYEHHIPSILYNKRMHLFSSVVAVRGNFQELGNIIKNHKLEQRKKRDQIYADLILLDKTSPKWKSEAQLFSLVSNKYPDAIYQYRADWLGMQSLDVYIPSLSIGIEYQGIQHYQPIEHFGGEDHFKQQQDNDRKKRELCKQNGVKLIEWAYDQEISEANLIEYIGDSKSLKNQDSFHTGYRENHKLTSDNKTKRRKIGTTSSKPNKDVLWSVEKKLEIVEKNIKDKTPVKVLAEEYKVSVSSLSSWVAAYKRYGESGLVDRRYKNK